MKKLIRKLSYDNRGIGIVEMVLILLVLVGLIVVFKTQASGIITSIFTKITTKVGAM